MVDFTSKKNMLCWNRPDCPFCPSMRKKEVTLKEIKFCVPEVACKLNEMNQMA
jgi:thioredoxin-related protein